MKQATKYIQPLERSSERQLEELVKSSPSYRVRQRAHAILLSSRQYSIEMLADIFSVHRTTVSQWIDAWHCDQFDSLEDAPRSGRPPKLTAEEQQVLIEAVENNPQRISQALLELKKDGQAREPSHCSGDSATAGLSLEPGATDTPSSA
jgi:transposase